MELVTNVEGQAHVTPIKALSMHQGIFGTDEYVLPTGKQFEATLVSNNELKIADGDAMMQGIHCHTKPKLTDSVMIENGTLNEKRIDLITLRREVVPEQNDIGRAEGFWHYIKGVPSEDAPVVPECIKGDIRAGDLINDMPFFEVELDGINVVEVRPVFKVLMDQAEVQRILAELTRKMLSGVFSSEEVDTKETFFGKKVYRKTFKTNASLLHNAPLEIAIGLEGIAEKLWIDTQNSFLRASGNNPTLTIPTNGYMNEPNTYVYVWANSSAVRLISNSGWNNNWEKVITVKYTKL